MATLKPIFKRVLTVADKSLQPDRTVHGLEQQPCGVQVVEWVGLVAGGFCIAVQFSAPILLFFSIHKNIGHLNG